MMKPFSGAAVLLFAFGGAALAADLPMKAPPRAVAASSGGFYFWVDGSYQSVNLPTYDLGFKLSATVGHPDLGSAQSFDPNPTGGGVAGAFGWVLPQGSWFAWGNNFRVELGGSYVDASDSQAGTGGNFPSATQLVNGTVVDFGCDPACSFGATLSTRYKAWTANLKAAGDYQFGGATVTPSVIVFGGRSTIDQQFAQTFALVPAPQPPTPDYLAISSVAWTDIGAKFGLDAAVPLTSSLILGAGGTIGFAGRDVSMAASDSYLAAVFSSTAASAQATALLANAEARLTFKPWANWALRAFGGVNFDDSVPGIARPTYTGPAAIGLQGTPAGIKFESETSLYAGGGITVQFGSGPAVVR
jgi:hypothetical protein